MFTAPKLHQSTLHTSWGRSIVLRLLLVCIAQVAAVHLLTSNEIAEIFRMTQYVPIGFGIEPWQVFCLLMILFIVLQKETIGIASGRPSITQIWLGIALLMMTMLFTTILTNPGEDTLSIIYRLFQVDTIFLPVFMKASIHTLFFLPSIPLLIALLPKEFLVTHWKHFILFYFVLICYLWISSVQYLFHDQFAQPLLSIVTFPVDYLYAGVEISYENLTMQYGNFVARIDPGCIGANTLFLFITFFVYGILHFCQHYRFSASKAMLAFFSGLGLIIFVNIVRIMMILFVGIHFIEYVDIFHNVIGGILAYFLLAFYIHRIFPWMVVKDLPVIPEENSEQAY